MNATTTRLAELLRRLDYGQRREFMFKGRPWFAGRADQNFYTMRSDVDTSVDVMMQVWPNPEAAADYIAQLLGAKEAAALAEAWASAWPTDADAMYLVLTALRSKRPLPWEQAHGELGELIQRAWTEVLWKDPAKDMHALGFLASSTKDQEEFFNARAGGYWTSNVAPVLLAAKVAGFKVPTAMLAGAVARLERIEAADAKRRDRKAAAIEPPPHLVRNLVGLRTLVRRAAKKEKGTSASVRYHGSHVLGMATTAPKVVAVRKPTAEEKRRDKERAAAQKKAERETAKKKLAEDRKADRNRKARDKRVAKEVAKQEAAAAKAQRATERGHSRQPAVCAAEAAERQARRELEDADRKALAASTKHGKAVERLEKAKCPTGKCAHKGKTDSRAVCTAKAKVGELAHALQRANAVRERARELHERSLLEIRRVGARTPPPPKSAGERPVARRAAAGMSPLSRSCGTVCHIHVEQGLCGGQATVLLSTHQGAPREIPTRYCLVEASTLITSHDPQTFDIDPRFPAATQERRYDKDRGEQMKVIQIAQNPRPELVFSTAADATSGTPVVTQDGESLLVLGGNGRSMGLRRHYRSGGTVFRDYLTAHAAEFGFTAAQVKKFRQPTIVRVIEAPRDQWVRLVRDLNQTLTQSMDVIAEGVSLARQMPPELLGILADNVGEGELGPFYDSRASLPLIHALERAGVITTSNRNRILGPNGLLNDEGKVLITRQISAAVLPDADLLEYLGPQLRGTLARSAPHIIAAAAAGGEWDVRPALARAVQDLLGSRARDLTVKQLFGQVDFLNPPATHRHPMGLRLLVLLDRLGGKPLVFSRVFKYFATESQLGRSQQSLLQAKTPTAALDEAAVNVGQLQLAKLVGELM